jgi:hypothetical protein
MRRPILPDEPSSKALADFPVIYKTWRSCQSIRMFHLPYYGLDYDEILYVVSKIKVHIRNLIIEFEVLTTAVTKSSIF